MPLRELLGAALGPLVESETKGNNAGTHKQQKQGVRGHDVPGNAQGSNDTSTGFGSQAGNGHGLSRAATLLS